MNSVPLTSLPGRIGSIFFPSDFRPASHVAFVHALKLAASASAKLMLFHALPEGEEIDWHEFPEVRRTLERWDLLPPGANRSDILRHLRFDVEKAYRHNDDPVEACLHFLGSHPADLVVLAPHPEHAESHWFGSRSVSRPLASESGEAALFVPDGVRGFVDPADGSASLRTILVPVAHQPGPRRAINTAARLAAAIGAPSVRFILLHSGATDAFPEVTTLENPGWTWEVVTTGGDPADAILDTAGAAGADLIVMTTEGRHGFLDALRGSTSERVLRTTPCPLAVVPAHREHGPL